LSGAPAGGLSQKLLEYTATMRDLVARAGEATDWGPLATFVAVDSFERVGTFLEVQDWKQYTEMLTRWARSVESFDSEVRRVTETGHLVFFEIEEHHRRRGSVHVVNSMTVFEFGADSLIERLSVYLQQRAP
jgi:hypothetical protein